MLKEVVDKKAKTISVETDYDFKNLTVEKHRDYFHLNFIKNANESMGSCLFFNQFGGRKYYPKEIDVKEVDVKNKKIELVYR